MKHTFWNIIGILSVITAFILAKSTTTITKEKTLTPGINIANMDPAFNPGNDFYEYATQKTSPGILRFFKQLHIWYFLRYFCKLST